MSAETVERCGIEPVPKIHHRGFPTFFNTKDKILSNISRWINSPPLWRKSKVLEQFPRHLQAWTDKDVLRVAKKYLTPDQFVVLVVATSRLLLATPTPGGFKTCFGSYHEWPGAIR